MSLAIEDLDVVFFGTTGLLVNLNDKREMRGRVVPLGMPICLHEVFGKTCFVELNLC